ncbi:type 1 periplasmic binding fold superfamily protein [Aurantibacter aestuarii]|uniref:Type 1 periplasmic binding fold superfamily protein n=1 Tax=Aurantibacter aestuarii TaxID=1266046 RepID=A0A2T1N8F0_9FLAO|nr:type 1 periplasmic binding fold superfamily protein [Aurantibacter aestuarii]PSG88140.1 type 1 periplasmic binding fold superfamily protein [Aurantibacter aestuarii]
MKNLKHIYALIILSIVFTSCSNDDDNSSTTLPAVVNEEEVITTLNVRLEPVGGGTVITLQTRDLDGDGPNPPAVTVSGNLQNGITYNGSIELLNETVDPADDITVEVEEEADEHQFFFTTGNNLDVTTTYENFDNNGNNLGTEFSLTANTISTGTLTFTLRHEPTKPNTGLADAGGETDISATFNLEIQ